VDPALPGAADSPCLLINPASFRASRRNLAGRAADLARRAGVQVFVLESFDELHPLLARLRAARHQQLWVLAGDGTLQAIAGWLQQLPAGDWSPALLPLAGGRANVVPRECGAYPAMPALRRALAALRAGQPLSEKDMTRCWTMPTNSTSEG
jgi:diacylglycerol kinase family enzyme